MKFKTLAFAVTAFSVAASINAASAIDGTINFTGVISANGCTVNSVAGIGATTGSVDFGQVNSTTLAGAGDASVATPFSIELTDCAPSTDATIAFNGAAVTTAGYTTLFESATDDVGIRITDASTGAVYTPGTSATNDGFSDLSSGSATGNFNAYLVAYNAGEKSGDVDASVTFAIAYQ
ncbi:fimbrial protein [Enterobacter ludwigii]